MANVIIPISYIRTYSRYDLVSQCWEESPEKRPSFEDLVKEINILLEEVAGYLEFSAFSGNGPIA